MVTSLKSQSQSQSQMVSASLRKAPKNAHKDQEHVKKADIYINPKRNICLVCGSEQTGSNLCDKCKFKSFEARLSLFLKTHLHKEGSEEQ